MVVQRVKCDNTTCNYGGVAFGEEWECSWWVMMLVQLVKNTGSNESSAVSER